MKKLYILLIILFIFSSLYCDEIILNILFTNDIHGGIDAVPATFMNPEYPPPLGGGAVAATYIKYVRQKAKENNESVLLLDAGDFFQGHPIGTMSHGEAVIKYMNMVKYDAMTIGNHEFDDGYERLKKTLSLAKFPIVCANIVQEKVIYDTTTVEKTIYDTIYITKEKFDTLKTKKEYKYIEYVVDKDDCLSKIAIEFLNQYSAWEHIYEYNKENIKNPDFIYPDQILYIPMIESKIIIKSLLDTEMVVTEKIIDSLKIKKIIEEKLIPESIPYIIKDIQGIKLAIIGLCTEETPMMSFPAHIEGLKFLPVAETAEKYIKEVKEKGADIITILAHLGIPYDVKSAYQRDIVDGHINDPERYWPDNAMHLAYKVKGIDMLFCGHIHKGYNAPWEEPNNHTLLFQNYAYGSNMGHAIIKIDEETKTISGYELPAYIDGDLLTLFSEEFIPDKEVKEKIDSMQAEAEKGMDDIIGEALIHLSRGSGAQSLIGNVVLDAVLEETDADFSFLNLGGIRDDIKRGYVTYRDIFDVLPFESQVVTIDISGALLKKILEIRVSYGHHGLRTAGGEIVYNRNLPNFERVTKIKIGGEDWDPDKIYKVTTTDFLMQGNAGLTILTEIPEEQIAYHYIIIRDALANYFKKHELVTSQIDNRWKEDNTSQPTETITEFNRKKRSSNK